MLLYSPVCVGLIGITGDSFFRDTALLMAFEAIEKTLNLTTAKFVRKEGLFPSGVYCQFALKFSCSSTTSNTETIGEITDKKGRFLFLVNQIRSGQNYFRVLK